MNFDAFLLSSVISELKHQITGGRIQKIRQHNESDITLEIRTQGKTNLLLISAESKFPRVYLTSSKREVPKQAPDFCMILRKHAEDKFVQSIEQVSFDRILKITISSHSSEPVFIVFELMGKHSNIILHDVNNRILGAIKHVGSSISRQRQILPGRDYMPPPGLMKVNPLEVSKTNFHSLWQENDFEINSDSVRSWLINTFSGIGPFFADEIINKSHSLTVNDVWDSFEKYADIIRNENYSPVFITNNEGHGLFVYSVATTKHDTGNQFPRKSVNEALDSLYRTLIQNYKLDDAKNILINSINRSLASRKNSLKSAQRTLDESKNSDKYKQFGELLLASVHLISTGYKEISLIDYYDPEMNEITIELDEKLTPQQNAQKYFKKYQKARDSASNAQDRINYLSKEIEELELTKSNSANICDVELINKTRKELLDKGLLRVETQRDTLKQPDEFGKFKIRRIYTPEGWEVLFGENSTSNDYLSTKVARPNDIWLHARSITGAHVVIRTAGRSLTNIPRSVMINAAMIAAQNSDAKHSSLVPVDYTFKKFVRKPKGAAAGYVVYKNEKTIDINPSKK